MLRNTRRAVLVAASAPIRCRDKIANSWPPSRAQPIPVRDRACQPLRDHSQQFVPHAMPVDVVHLLEPILSSRKMGREPQQTPSATRNASSNSCGWLKNLSGS